MGQIPFLFLSFILWDIFHFVKSVFLPLLFSNSSFSLIPIDKLGKCVYHTLISV